MENFLADAYERIQVRIQENDADTAIVGEVTQYVNKTQVRKHGKDAYLPCVFDNLGRTAPAEHVELVRINLDKQERLAGSVCTQKLLVQPRLEKSGGVNDIL